MRPATARQALISCGAQCVLRAGNPAESKIFEHEQEAIVASFTVKEVGHATGIVAAFGKALVKRQLDRVRTQLAAMRAQLGRLAHELSLAGGVTLFTIALSIRAPASCAR